MLVSIFTLNIRFFDSLVGRFLTLEFHYGYIYHSRFEFLA